MPALFRVIAALERGVFEEVSRRESHAAMGLIVRKRPRLYGPWIRLRFIFGLKLSRAGHSGKKRTRESGLGGPVEGTVQ